MRDRSRHASFAGRSRQGTRAKAGGEIDDRRDLVRIGQQIFKVAAPARRIIADEILADRGPIEDGLDAATQAHRSLGLNVPDWPQHFHDQVGVDIGDRQRAEHRGRVIGQRGFPLRDVLRVLPAGAVRADV